MKSICVLGSTGSIGVSTLDVVARHPDRYKVTALTANRNIDALFDQCIQHKPDYAVMVDTDCAGVLEQRLKESATPHVQVLAGAKALEEVASLPEIDSVMAAIVGAAGLLSTLAAAHAGKCVLLANKEALVMSGQLLMNAITHSGAQLLPIDSEHNAIFQCMPAHYQAGVSPKEARRILLTASGGPFRETPIEQLERVTPEQAVAHPNWDMGKKISVDSATMMNKGLELIEASLLFDMPAERIQVVIHPQSVIHSMVDYVDGTVLAQLGNPDMRIPIAHALAWPERFESGAEPLDIFSIKRLDFEPPDEVRFPCLKLAYDAVEEGGIMPAVLNAANEIAVDSFLSGRISYTEIASVIDHSMAHCSPNSADSLASILESDREARAISNAYIDRNL
jgi:1-deoxy-D-xylulose-5-phosphate reductoisomerase